MNQFCSRVKQIEEVLTLTERSLHAEKVVPDVSIDYPGWEMYKESSKESMINWNAYIRVGSWIRLFIGGNMYRYDHSGF
jgi:hypothetical protein